MPSVRGGSALTGFSLRNLAVDEEFRSEEGILGLLGARNWKNSYSATYISKVSRCSIQARRLSLGNTNLLPLRLGLGILVSLPWS